MISLWHICLPICPRLIVTIFIVGRISNLIEKSRYELINSSKQIREMGSALASVLLSFELVQTLYRNEI